MVPFSPGGSLVCILTSKARREAKLKLFPLVFRLLLLPFQRMVGLFFEEDSDGRTSLKTVGVTKAVAMD